jgi:SSS family solute:Na+ symporter
MTNVVEFVMMYAGFAVMVAVALPAVGGFSGLAARVPPLHLVPTGGHDAQYIAVWFFIALWTMVDPSFHQRSAAAKDERTARNGVLVSVAFWFMFDAMTVSTGMAARALLPDLAQPALAYPTLAVLILPDGLRGVFFVGLFATVMSTLTSMLMLGGLTAGRDVVARWKSVDDEVRIKRWVRIGTVFSGVVAVALAWLFPSVVTLWYTVGTALIPGLLIPVLGCYLPFFRLRARATVYLMAMGSTVSTGSLVWGYWRAVDGVPQYWWGVEPLLPGLAVTAAIWSLARWKERRSPAASEQRPK